MLLGPVADRQEVVAMPHGLHQLEQGVQRDRRGGRESELRGGKLRPRRARGEGRFDQDRFYVLSFLNDVFAGGGSR